MNSPNHNNKYFYINKAILNKCNIHSSTMKIGKKSNLLRLLILLIILQLDYHLMLPFNLKVNLIKYRKLRKRSLSTRSIGSRSQQLWFKNYLWSIEDRFWGWKIDDNCNKLSFSWKISNYFSIGAGSIFKSNWS